MRMLILGGTGFLGRHLAHLAIAEGHHVTLFNRGRTAPGLFPEAAHLVGDRDGDLLSLFSARRRPGGPGTWEAVFDFSGFLPAQVRRSAGLLATHAAHYTFMSSIAVYPRSPEHGRTERAPVRRLPDGTPEPDHFTADTYGPLKADCEREVAHAFPGRSTRIRAGLVTGPGDPFGAFPGWALAMAGDGTVPCAARPGQPLQVTDVRDLAAFLLRVGATDRRAGAFNVMADPVRFDELLETCGRAGGGTATVRWTGAGGENVDRHAAGIVQPHDGSDDGAFTLSNTRALAAGYRPRPLADTARDLVDWARRTNPTFTSPH